MAKKNELVLMNGKGVMTVEGMERICQALLGKGFTPAERKLAQSKIDAVQAARSTTQGKRVKCIPLHTTPHALQ